MSDFRTTWKTDAQMHETAADLANKIIKMYGYFQGDPEHYPRSNLQPVIDGIRADAEEYMCLDPKKMADELVRLLDIAKKIGENTEAEKQLGLALDHLSGWHGTAADAFKGRLHEINTVCDQQQTDILTATFLLAEATKVAIAGRLSWVELAEATIAKCEQEIGEQAKKDTEAAISLVADLVKDVVDMDPKKLITLSVDLLIDVGKAGATYAVEGNNAEEVTSSYIRCRDSLLGTFTDSLTMVRNLLTQIHGNLEGEPFPLAEPLPSNTNVESPDFSYKEFRSKEYEPGSFGPKVEQTREKYVAEKQADQQSDSEIHRRLGTAN